MKNSIIIVTGGAGAIGVNLVNSLLKLDVARIIILDNLSSGNKDYLPKNNKVEFNYVDISQLEELSTIMNAIKPDYIFHLAAHFANQNSVDHPLSDVQTNIIGTINLLELSKNNKNLKKFIYASSSCVYGDNEFMQEKNFIYPHETPYAINKYTAELYTKYYAHLFSIPSISIRIFNSYGAYEIANKYRNVIPKFIENALTNKDIIITGDGNETRDFTYSGDVVELLVLSASSKVANGEYFNGGTGKETKIIDLAKMIIDISQSKSKIIFKPRRNWDLVAKRISDTSKSNEVLGYNPTTTLYDGLKKNIQWYKGYLNDK